MQDRASLELRDVREAWELVSGQFRPDPSELPDPSPSEGPDPYGEPDPEWLRIDWREQLRSVEVADTRINYAELGTGDSGAPDLVLVHGLAGAWQNWLENIPYFARSHRVVALDLPGFGASPMPPWEIDVPAYGRVIHEFCDAIGIGDAAIVGNSLGGFVAAGAAVSDPSRFESPVRVSAAGISHADWRPEPAALAGRLAVGLAPLALSFQERAMRRPKLRNAAFGSVFWDP